MKNLIESYITAQALAWSPSTLRSERYRLLAVQASLSSPEVLWAAIQDLKPYSRATTWTRVCGFMDWLIETGAAQGPNNFSVWRKHNARVFKNVYAKKTPTMSFEEAAARVERLPAESKAKAKELLASAMRFSESLTFDGKSVVGKGGKRRNVYGSTGAAYGLSYTTFYRHLATIGIKPHELRKLRLAKLVEQGANEFELKAIAGWESLNTASSYISAKQEKLKKFFE